MVLGEPFVSRAMVGPISKSWVLVFPGVGVRRIRYVDSIRYEKALAKV
jgi:hypothetical protein